MTTKDDTPALPVTWTEIVDAAVSCWRAGAAIIHLHARDERGIPTQDREIYQLLIERIRDAGCEAILNVSTATAAGRAEGANERLAVVGLKPEMATLDCGSVNIADHRVLQRPYDFLRQAAQAMQDHGVVPEIEVFEELRTLQEEASTHLRSLRPAHRHWLHTSSQGTFLEVFEATPATSLAYQMLLADLKRIDLY